jgi:hypothetical protein
MMVCAAAWRQGPQTPSISGYQAKNTYIVGYQAKRPKKGKKYFLRRAKKPDNQWFGFHGKKQVGRKLTRGNDYVV